jgi:hypothetical protein
MYPNGNPMVKYAFERASIKPTLRLYTFDLATNVMFPSRFARNLMVYL